MGAGLPLYPLDLIQYRAGGGKVRGEEFLAAYAEILGREEWIIDGFGSVATAWDRFSQADTPVYIDPPLGTHYAWIAKRLLKSRFVRPEGWPAGSPMWRSMLDSYKVAGRCHRLLTPRYRKPVADMAGSKRVHHPRSPAEMADFLCRIQRDRFVRDEPSAD